MSQPTHPPHGDDQPGQYPPPSRSGVRWGPPGAPGGGPPQGNRNTVLALVVAGIVALAAVAVALVLVLGNRDDDPAAAGSDRTTDPDRTTTAPEEPGDTGVLPDPTATPEGLGNDPLLDALATACYGGDMRSCDELFDRSDAGSDYESYGDSCAGRQPPGSLVNCTETFPWN